MSGDDARGDWAREENRREQERAERVRFERQQEQARLEADRSERARANAAAELNQLQARGYDQQLEDRRQDRASADQARQREAEEERRQENTRMHEFLRFSKESYNSCQVCRSASVGGGLCVNCQQIEKSVRTLEDNARYYQELQRRIDDEARLVFTTSPRPPDDWEDAAGLIAEASWVDHTEQERMDDLFGIEKLQPIPEKATSANTWAGAADDLMGRAISQFSERADKFRERADRSQNFKEDPVLDVTAKNALELDRLLLVHELYNSCPVCRSSSVGGGLCVNCQAIEKSGRSAEEQRRYLDALLRRADELYATRDDSQWQKIAGSSNEENLTTSYGRTNIRVRRGDDLEGHEIIEHAFLKALGVVGESRDRENAVIFLTDERHKAVSRAQHEAGLHDPERLARMSISELLDRNIECLLAAGVPTHAIDLIVEDAMEQVPFLNSQGVSYFPHEK